MPCSVEGVPFDYLFQGWPLVKDMLRPAIERTNGALDEKSVVKALAQRAMQLWVIMEGESDAEEPIAALVTEIITYPTGLKICRGILVGGRDNEKWRTQAEDVISAWARSEGCSFLQEIGRYGWERVLEKQGWKRGAVIMEKTL